MAVRSPLLHVSHVPRVKELFSACLYFYFLMIQKKKLFGKVLVPPLRMVGCTTEERRTEGRMEVASASAQCHLIS